jgi:cardiolipin synthase
MRAAGLPDHPLVLVAVSADNGRGMGCLGKIGGALAKSQGIYRWDPPLARTFDESSAVHRFTGSGLQLAPLNGSELMRGPKPQGLIAVILLITVVLAIALLIAQDQETLRVRAPLGADDPRFPDYLARLLGDPLSGGDSYRVLTNGTVAFPAMLAAIDRAKSRISFESYIFEPGKISRQFTTAFEAAAARGVDVRIVLDAIGAKKIDKDHLGRLQAAGCKIGWFNTVGSYSIEELNYRAHRKALVVDGAVAFVGGIGVADQWAFNTGDQPPWRDTQIEIHGPAALNVEAAFNENWIETGGVVEPDLLPQHNAPTGHARSIVVWSSPIGGTNNLKLLYLLAIAAARRSLDIESPYFITDESTMWSLREARQRGVHVRILTEGGITDAKAVKFASRADYESFLEQGMEIFEYQPTMMHAKAIIIDDTLSIVGSANFDNRSLELNDELNVAVFDGSLASRLRADFEVDVSKSTRLNLDAWRSRPLHIRGREKLWSLFGEVF